jgi:hypothetical protein
MTTPQLKPESWVWVIVQDPDADAQYFGQQDGETGESYIPAFYEKEAAKAGLQHLSARAGKPLEIQAVHLGDLSRDAERNGFLIFMLSPEGRIVAKLPPGRDQDCC